MQVVIIIGNVQGEPCSGRMLCMTEIGSAHRRSYMLPVHAVYATDGV